jgi:hypothetical protein
MELEDFMLSEISQIQKNTACFLSLMVAKNSRPESMIAGEGPGWCVEKGGHIYSVHAVYMHGKSHGISLV